MQNSVDSLRLLNLTATNTEKKLQNLNFALLFCFKHELALNFTWPCYPPGFGRRVYPTLKMTCLKLKFFIKVLRYYFFVDWTKIRIL
jgi:hypothetical protein